MEADIYNYFDRYERRFASAMAAIPNRRPWMAKEKAQIVRAVRDCLGIRDEWVPQIRAETAGRSKHDGFSLELLRFTSWPGTIGTAWIYVPEEKADKLPAVLLCCGHGNGGKCTSGYQAMARHLARLGALVVVPDNIGQGERESMGHADAVVPFACGTSMQGLIVMETMGWVRWLNQDPRVDSRRMAAIGNSGGGTLTLFLGALCPELATICSSGYPSSFEFIARKEKKHCHCNIIPRMVGEIEMWQVYGCVAPRPLFLFQGNNDNLFPPDIFHATARKVRSTFAMAGAEEKFSFKVVEGNHAWDLNRIDLVGRYLAKIMGLPHQITLRDEKVFAAHEAPKCLEKWPAEALTTDDLARQVTGQNPPAGLKLWDVFPPDMPADAATIKPLYGGLCDVRQVLAQFEAFLKRP